MDKRILYLLKPSHFFRLLNQSQIETGHLNRSLAPHQPFHPNLRHTIPNPSSTLMSPSYSSLKSGQDENAAIGVSLDRRSSCHSVFSRAIWSSDSLVLLSNNAHVATTPKLVPILWRLCWNRASCSWAVVTEDDPLSGTDARCLSRITERSCSCEGCITTDDGCDISLAKYPLSNGWITPCCRAGIELGSDSICTAPSSVSWAVLCWAINLGQSWSYQI